MLKRQVCIKLMVDIGKIIKYTPTRTRTTSSSFFEEKSFKYIPEQTFLGFS